MVLQNFRKPIVCPQKTSNQNQCRKLVSFSLNSQHSLDEPAKIFQPKMNNVFKLICEDLKRVVFLSLITLPLSEVPRLLQNYANGTTTLFSFFSHQIFPRERLKNLFKRKQCGFCRVLRQNSDFTSFNLICITLGKSGHLFKLQFSLL